MIAIERAGGATDARSALSNFQLACSYGLAMGCGNYAITLLGKDTPPELRDDRRGMEYLDRACRGGYGVACEVLRQLRP